MAAVKEIESREAAMRVSRAKKHNAQQGFFNGGHPPYGYEAVAAGQPGNTIKKILRPKSVEANIVSQMYRLVLSGGGGSGPTDVNQVADRLNRRGHLTRNGGKWTTRAVRRLLRNPVYVGEYLYYRQADQSERVPVGVPPIVPVGVFQAVQRLI